jgi:hypothetical protein
MRFFVEMTIFFSVYIGVIFIRIIVLWVRISPRGFWTKAHKFLVNVTE